MKYLIFGGTGFVGSKLERYLLELGEEVMTVSRSGIGNSVSVDIADQESFRSLDFFPDVIINCASKLPEISRTSKDPDFLQELFSTNAVGGTNVANWAVQNGVQRIINCSTLVVVKKPWPNPLDEGDERLPEGFHVGYAMSKLAQEKLMHEVVRETGTKVLHVRLSAVYGKGMNPQGVIFDILNNAVRDQEIRLVNGKRNTLDLVHVEDVAKTLVELSRSEEAFRHPIVNLASGREVSVHELARGLKKLAGSNSVIIDNQDGDEMSHSNVSTALLQKLIPDNHKDFISLEEGLTPLVEEYLREK